MIPSVATAAFGGLFLTCPERLSAVGYVEDATEEKI